MQLTRRRILQTAAAAVTVKAADRTGWNADWDRALIETAVRASDKSFDPAESMLARRVGNAYNYHSGLRNTTVHPTRDSLLYALMLLEAGGEDRTARAAKIVERVISIQETDPASKFYGIWGYHLEEPAPKMSPADWNWADFNGSLLLLITFRHAGKLPVSLRSRVLESIRHAAYSVKRRNVTMSYTNIAVQGTFVTLAAADLLGDQELWAYATDRQKRFAATVDESGSFAEYNSPTYANVTIINLTRIRMFVKDDGVLALNSRLHDLVWQHLGNHWHVPTRQLAGPMSRCYSTDIGSPLWLQKALGGRLAFATLDELKAGRVSGDGEIATADYQCPEKIAPLFLEGKPPHEHREQFSRGIWGTTWLDRDYALGSVNRGNFWVQQRAVLAYWGGSSRPAHYAHLRVMHDDYDFSSALAYTVQDRNRVLGLINFRNPGGDKHISLDMIRDGEFKASSVRLRLEIADPEAKAVVKGDTAEIAGAGGVRLSFCLAAGMFGGKAPVLKVASEEGRLAIVAELLGSAEPTTVKWSEVGEAFVAFTLAVNDANPARCSVERKAGRVALSWAGLELSGAAVVADIKQQDAAFVSRGA